MPRKKPAKKSTIPQSPVDENHFLNASLTMQRVQLEVKKFVARSEFDERAMLRSVDMQVFHDEAARRMVMQMQAHVASKKLAVKTVQFPDGPWQFVKFNLISSRWYKFSWVRAFLKRFPVRYISVTLEANAYYPSVEIPDHAAFVEIAMNTSRRY